MSADRLPVYFHVDRGRAAPYIRIPTRQRTGTKCATPISPSQEKVPSTGHRLGIKQLVAMCKIATKEKLLAADFEFFHQRSSPNDQRITSHEKCTNWVSETVWKRRDKGIRLESECTIF